MDSEGTQSTPDRTPVIFNEEVLENDQVASTFNGHLDSVGLTPEETKLVKDDFRKRMLGVKNRRKHDKKPIDSNFTRGLLTWAMTEAKNQAEQILVDREKLATHEVTEKRLCPELAGKTKMELDFNDRFEQLKQSKGEGEEGKIRLMVLVNFDLDDFKLVNDTYGHEEGDKLIQSAGKALHTALRRPMGDVGAHFSGDEFGALLDIELPLGTKPEEVEGVVKKIITDLVERVQRAVVRPDGQEQQISTGYTVVRHDSHGAYSDFAKKADDGQEGSKIFKVLPGADGKPVRGPERVIESSKRKEIESKYPPTLIARLKAIRAITRQINELEAKGLILKGIDPKAIAEQILASIMITSPEAVTAEDVENKYQQLIKERLQTLQIFLHQIDGLKEKRLIKPDVDTTAMVEQFLSSIMITPPEQTGLPKE